MLNTLLLVLKIVGIVLLCIIGILLLLVILVMFVPVRYKGNASKENGEDNPVYALAGVSWLLHIISAAFEYKEGKTLLSIKVFGIRIRNSEERRERRKQKEERRRNRCRSKEASAEQNHLFKKNKKKCGSKRWNEDDEAEYTIYEYNKDGLEIKTENGGKNSKTAVYVEEHEEGLDIEYPSQNNRLTDTVNDKKENFREENEKTDKDDRIRNDEGGDSSGLFGRFAEKAERITEKIGILYEKLSKGLQRTADRAKDTLENIDYYHTALCNDSKNREVLVLLTSKLKRLLRAVRPRKVRGSLNYGSDDPASTGRILAGAAVLYPWYGKSITIEPDFSGEVLAFELFLKGRIYLCVVAGILLQLYFNRKVRRFIRIMKKENKANG